MGITSKSAEVIFKVLDMINSDPQQITVAELGAQNLYRGEYDFDAVVGKWAYAVMLYLGERDVKEYVAIDLSGENGSKEWDLSKPLKTNKQFDLVTDFGTSEHVDDYYQAFANVDKLTKVGGFMIHENPKTGNWPQHGKNYVDQEFYNQLAQVAGYEIIQLEEHPAMGNEVDGWNVIAVLRKTKDEFIKRNQFPKYHNA